VSDVGEVSPASVFAELQAGEWEDARSAASLPTRLKRQRELCSLTQEELAERSGISLRSIQMYEQRVNDIDKAQAQTIYKLSRVIGCSMEDLLEKPME
jgi:transcriptional regulator with XRE-family HTH domain